MQNNRIKKSKQQPIAIIGVGVTAKRAVSPGELRQHLKNGSDLIGKYPVNRYDDSLLFFEDSFRHEMMGKEFRRFDFLEGAFLENVDHFDTTYFNISPLEARLMDPAQRIFLECVMKTLQNAGYGGETLRGSLTGVFAGYMPDQRPFNYRDLALHLDGYDFDQVTCPNLISIIPSRISYFLDLQGPAICLDTSCSSTLVAIHMACQSLRLGECDYAIAGGIKINLAPLEGLPRPKIESNDNRSKVFDQNANGIGIGEGATSFLLKPLDKALADNDHIWAVIKGSAINQDGRSEGIARPNAAAQTRVILDAWDSAGIDPENIGLIEAHGTGTEVGDPIEANAIIQAFQKVTPKKQFCAIGSVKANYGHLYEAAGGLSFLKAILSVHHGEIYPQINFSEPTSKIDFIESPLYIPLENRSWSASEKRLAGISAFGVSGTNCHIVLEQSPDIPEQKRNDERACVFIASGRSYEELLDQLERIKSHILIEEISNAADLSFSAAFNYRHFDWRFAVVISGMDALLKALEEPGMYIREVPALSENELEEFENNGNLTPAFVAEEFLKGRLRPAEEYYRHNPGKRLQLPAFKFRRDRHWLEADHKVIAKIRKRDPRHYDVRWVVSKEETSTESAGSDSKHSYLVIDKKSPWHERFRAWAREHWPNVQFFDAAEVDTIEIETLRNADRIIHSGGIFELTGNGSSIEKEQEEGMFSLWRLLQRLAECKSKKEKEIYLLGSPAFPLSSDQGPLYPIAATFFGLGRIVSREFSNVKCCAIQIDPNAGIELAGQTLMARSKNFQRAIYDETVYEQEFGPVDFNDHDSQLPLKLDPDASYLITGGTGGLGLEMAKYLAERGAGHIGLLSRSGEIKDNNGLQILEEIRLQGCRTYLLGADCTNEDELRKAIGNLERAGGTLKGVVHAAGLPGASLVTEQLRDSFLRVSKPKIEGTLYLHNIAVEKQLDFVILYSSVATLFPAIGQGDYCAANSYLDACVSSLRGAGIRAFCFNWVAWKDTGMAYDLDVNVNTTFKAISTEDAMYSLDVAIRNDLPKCLIGELNPVPGTREILESYGVALSSDLLKLVESSGQFTGTIKAGVEQCNHNVVLKGLQNRTPSELEKLIASAYAGVLGYDSIDVNANIYDLGADSLMIAKVVNACRNELNISIDIGDVLVAGSIAAVAQMISQDYALAQAN